MTMSNKAERVIQEDLCTIIARDLPWHEFSGRKIVVTGAGGFLGGYLVRTLLALHQAGRVSKPLNVLILVRDVARARIRLQSCIDDPQLSLMQWDLNSVAVPDLGGVDYIIHSASNASPKHYGSDPVGTILPNAVGTAALLQALSKSTSPKGMLFVSSSEIYGSISIDRGLRESDSGFVDPMNPRACYAESKRAGEAICVAFHNQLKIPTWVVRPFHTYGPGLAADDGRVFADFAYNVARGQNIVMSSDGTARRAFCYVTDAAAGIFTTIFRGKPGTAYNIANAQGELSVNELAEMLVKLFPSKGLKVERRINDSPAGYLRSAVDRMLPDTSRIESLGWRAEVPPTQGFTRFIEALT